MDEPAPSEDSSSNVALAVFAAVAATVGMLGGLALWSEENAGFLREKQSVIWELALVVQSALWAGVAMFLLRSLRKLRKTYALGERTPPSIRTWTVLVGLLGGVGAVPTLLLVPDYPLSDDWLFRTPLALFGLAVLALATISMATVGAASRRILDEPPELQLEAYLQLRSRLHDLLNATAAVLLMLLVGGAALRGAIVATGVSAEEFPTAYFIYFGATYSVLLAFAYGPAYRDLREVGTELRNRLQPLPTAAPAARAADAATARSWVDWCADRKALDTLLELDIVGTKSIKTGLALATPLLVSAAGVLFGIGK